jgi:hypothetical protein
MEMKKYILPILVIVHIQFCFGQDYINYEKELFIIQLRNLGFDTISGSEKLIIETSNVVIAQFNENYCTYIDYHMKNDGEFDFCDSIFCTSTCNECFDVTLNSFLSIKNRKWKKNEENEYFSLKNEGKSISYGPYKDIKYRIEKLEVLKSTSNKQPSFYIHRVWATKSEYKRLKKLKKYR